MLPLLHGALAMRQELQHHHHQSVVLGGLLGRRAPHDGIEPIRQNVPRAARLPRPLAGALAALASTLALAGALAALRSSLARVRVLVAGAVAGPTLGHDLETAERKQLLVGVHEQRLHDLAARVAALLEDSLLGLRSRDGLLGVLAHQDCRTAWVGKRARAARGWALSGARGV